MSVLPVLDDRTLAAVYRRAALLVFPSDREGFGLPLCEALAWARRSWRATSRSCGKSAAPPAGIAGPEMRRRGPCRCSSLAEPSGRRRPAGPDGLGARSPGRVSPISSPESTGSLPETAIPQPQRSEAVPPDRRSRRQVLSARSGRHGNRDRRSLRRHGRRVGRPCRCRQHRPRTVHERVGAVTVVRAAAFGSRHSVPLCPSLPIHLWRAAADCVVLHEPNPIAGCALFLRMPAPRLVVWHHSDLLRPWWAPATYGRVQRALYRRAECVIVSSPNLATHSDLVRHARRVAVVPFGIRSSGIGRRAPGALAELLRAPHCGSARPLRRPVRVLQGHRRAHRRDGATRGTLLLVGEGPLEASCGSAPRTEPSSSACTFLGRVPDADLPAYYQAADVFVLPSVARTEAFGVVQVEAMAAGLPVVSTNLPTGVPWVNQDGVSGLVVPPGDAHALAAAIARLGDDSDRGSGSAPCGPRRIDVLPRAHGPRVQERGRRGLTRRRGRSAPRGRRRRERKTNARRGAFRRRTARVRARLGDHRRRDQARGGGPIFFSQTRVGERGPTSRRSSSDR